MKLHPDDAARLEKLDWEPGLCAISDHQQPQTVLVDGDRLCRECLGYRLTLHRGHPINATLRGEAAAAGVTR